MNYILIPLLIVFMAFTAYSLIRGIVAFLNSTRDDLNHDPASGPSPSQLKQNKMMFNRILYHGLAVLVVGILLAIGSK